jgi:GntR family transcriptional regulator
VAEHTAEEIEDHYRGLILSGRVGAGDKLPTVRQTASDFTVALGTAAKAYKSLEAEGVIVTRGAAGTRVAASSSILPGALIAEIGETVVVAKASGVSQSDVLRLIKTIWDDNT